MTVAEDLAALDAAHRQRQAANAQSVAQAVLAYWLAVDSANIKGTGGEWLERSTELIVRGRAKSTDLATAYAKAVRQTRIPGDLPPLRVEPVNVDQIRSSLTFTGLANAAIKTRNARRVASLSDAEAQRQVSYSIAEIFRRERQQVRETGGDRAERALVQRALELTIRRAMEDAGAAAAASAVRHVQNGGRSITDGLVKADARLVGYVRVTRPNCCYFCAMLASRGPVFKGDSFAQSDPRFDGEGAHKVHDSCGCTLRPVYSRDPFEWPDLSREFEDLWNRVARGKSPKEAIRAFRRAYEGRSAAGK